MKIFAIIVTHNAKRWIDRCFGSLVASSVELEIVVIDNASTDETVEYLKKKFDFVIAGFDPQSSSHSGDCGICRNDANNVIFPQSENLGFGKANNIGIKYALDNDADYVFLLNQDAWIEEDTIEKLLSLSVSGITAPMQVDAEGKNLDLKFQQIYLSEENASGLINDLYFNRLKPYYEANLVNAAAILISRDCIEKVGGFDTSLFYHYGEDWNYCQRVKYHRFKIVIAPQIKVIHDREERQGKFSANFENAWESIEPKVRLGNILMPDSEFEVQIKHLHKIRIFKILKAVFTLKPNRIRGLQKEIDFDKIRESRRINKKGSMVWLS
ncbi:MAG: glycosyltransferase family 2 protein [Dysgonamonadaceae bacterium]|jgi:GT2 family glycosyltransferase|nr:glycosyltransferase family 2 protein [Dysgonamonadaceae bacterium]